jgi:hypothetical protein
MSSRLKQYFEREFYFQTSGVDRITDLLYSCNIETSGMVRSQSIAKAKEERLNGNRRKSV